MAETSEIGSPRFFTFPLSRSVPSFLFLETGETAGADRAPENKKSHRIRLIGEGYFLLSVSRPNHRVAPQFRELKKAPSRRIRGKERYFILSLSRSFRPAGRSSESCNKRSRFRSLTDVGGYFLLAASRSVHMGGPHLRKLKKKSRPQAPYRQWGRVFDIVFIAFGPTGRAEVPRIKNKRLRFRRLTNTWAYFLLPVSRSVREFRATMGKSIPIRRQSGGPSFRP